MATTTGINGGTAIRVSADTWLRLSRRITRPGTTMNQVVAQLLDESDAALQAAINKEAIEQ